MPSARALVSCVVVCLSSCTSLWQQRDHQQVTWDDGDPARVEVWLRQGTTWVGQPWLFVLDLLGTPVLVVSETFFAVAAAEDEDKAIAWGPLGYVVSLLPGITCAPIDARPSVWLRLREPLRLPASERARLGDLSADAGVEWLAYQYAQQDPRGVQAANAVRDWVVAVRLVPVNPTAQH